VSTAAQRSPTPPGRPLPRRILPRLDRREVVAVFAGGAVGTLLRAALSEAFPQSATSWPWPTFVVNVVAAVLLGYFVTRLQERLPISSYRRPLLGTGLCGGLSTFSTMQVELLKMIDAGAYGLALGYAAARRAPGVVATMNAVVWAGVVLIGGCGSVLRFVVDGAVAARLGKGFPFGTLVVNVSGAMILGLITGLALSGSEALLAGTAAVGSYTTFSTWMLETQRLAEERQNRSAALNVVVSLVLGVAAAALGRLIGAHL
jgi:fluoride exporter